MSSEHHYCAVISPGSHDQQGVNRKVSVLTAPFSLLLMIVTTRADGQRRSIEIFGNGLDNELTSGTIDFVRPSLEISWSTSVIRVDYNLLASSAATCVVMTFIVASRTKATGEVAFASVRAVIWAKSSAQ